MLRDPVARGTGPRERVTGTQERGRTSGLVDERCEDSPDLLEALR